MYWLSETETRVWHLVAAKSAVFKSFFKKFFYLLISSEDN